MSVNLTPSSFFSPPPSPPHPPPTPHLPLCHPSTPQNRRRRRGKKEQEVSRLFLSSSCVSGTRPRRRGRVSACMPSCWSGPAVIACCWGPHSPPGRPAWRCWATLSPLPGARDIWGGCSWPFPPSRPTRCPVSGPGFSSWTTCSMHEGLWGGGHTINTCLIFSSLLFIHPDITGLVDWA